MVNRMNGKLTLILGLLLCSGPGHALNILACETEWGALARAVAGPEAQIVVATDPSQDPHHIEARPSLISATRRADMVACTGAGLEAGWLPLLLSRGANPSVQRAPGLFLAAEHVTLLDKPERLDRSEGDIHASGNPHLHLDPRNFIALAHAMARQLGELQPAHAQRFADNAENFSRRWEARIADWEARAATLRGQTVVVHHRSWRYLLDWLEGRQLAELEPKPGLPPTPGHLAALVAQLKGEAPPPLILYTRFNGDRAARWLADRSSGCAVELPFAPADTAGEAALGAFFDTLIERLLAVERRCAHGN